jgi:hypothetical protein
MPLDQLVGLEHADPLADRDGAGVKSQLQRAPRRFTARPGVVLLHQHVVVDVADRDGAVLPDPPENLVQVLFLHRSDPRMRHMAVLPHLAEEEAQVARRHVGQRMRPVFEHGLIDRLGLAQILAPVARNARIQHVVVRALDHVDRIDLDVAEMLDRGARRLRTGAERCRHVESLGMKPQPPRLRLVERMGFFRGT